MKRENPEETDHSNGYEAVANDFSRLRRMSGTGVGTIRRWAKPLRPGSTMLDLGCGSGEPIAVELNRLGFQVAGVDASPTLIAEFRRHLPGAPWACEAVECSTFFGGKFDAVIAIGLMFILPAEVQRIVIAKVGEALVEGGKFLFTAPHQACSWVDVLTGRPSESMGSAQYESSLHRAGMAVTARYVDEGENHYFDCRKG
jgi:2-polyprenyl-3-methyl-5-hydroxy-6-metoxy-1,4-benzoquinol methylase